MLANERVGYYMGWEPLYLTPVLFVESDFTARFALAKSLISFRRTSVRYKSVCSKLLSNSTV